MKIDSPRQYGVIAVYILIGALALGLRVHLAGFAYPAQGDVPAIVAQGILLAQGDPAGIAGIYPEIPVLMAAAAYRAGFDPAETLQAANVVYGTMVVLMVMLFARRFFDRHPVAWMAGALAVVNNGLLTFSANSMPETGFGMCLMAACAVLARALRGMPSSRTAVCGGYAVLGLGIYYRPIETLLSLAVITGWIVIMRLRDPKKCAAVLAPGLVCAVLVLAPYYVKAQSRQVDEDRVSFNMKSIAFGDLAYDGKQIHDPDRQDWKDEMTQEVIDLGLPRWLWEHRGDVSGRYFKNLLRSVRIYSDYMFGNAFRLGNGWFIFLMAAIAWSAWKGPYRREYLFLALMLVSLPAAVSLGYIFNRYLLAYLPFLFVMACAFVVFSPPLWSGPARKGLWTAALALMLWQSYAVTIRGHRDQEWYSQNLREVAGVLREIVPYGKRIITPQDAFMLEFDLDEPTRWKKFPYSEPDRFEAYASARNVSHIVLCTTEKSHWPIYKLMDGAPPPASWNIVYEKKFERLHPVWGVQEQTYRIYERTDTGAPD